jgi:NAD(P)H-hydrate epimerase
VVRGSGKQIAVTVRAIQALDKFAIKRMGIPSIVLMENAGRALAEEVLKLAKKKARVLIVCGTGNNGGDGLVAARHLKVNGARVVVCIVGSKTELKEDPKINYAIVKALRIPVIFYKKPSCLPLKRTDVVIDALFGAGLNRPLQEPYRSVIGRINQSGAYVIACDIPSGLDGTTGKVHGCCVKADKTVTFTLLKTGFFRNAGPSYIGKAVVRNIGLPPDWVKRIGGQDQGSWTMLKWERSSPPFERR